LAATEDGLGLAGADLTPDSAGAATALLLLLPAFDITLDLAVSLSLLLTPASFFRSQKCVQLA
jgi:hypothetical protein